jgi:dimethylsulfone monooxygenase
MEVRLVALNTRMQSPNKFKLGLFGMNCSCSVATTAPERWEAGWDGNLEAARLADEAGIEFLLPIARWQGYGGSTDRHGTSLETLTWATGLLAATERITVFGTVHVALINPVFAAKQAVTADNVGHGRFGLNVVSGWNTGEFKMFGVPLRDHDERYAYTEEWLKVTKRIWTEEQPFDFRGAYFNLDGVGGRPKPYGNSHPLIMSAGSSSTGRAFAVRNADCLFMMVDNIEALTGEIAAIRAAAGGRAMGVFASGHLISRATRKQTDEYYHYIVHENGDWEAAEQAIAKRLQGDWRSAPKERVMQMKERFISGGGTFPVIGSYDEAADILRRLSDAGLSGMALSMVNYVRDVPLLRDEIIPRMARLGVRGGRNVRRDAHV